MALPRQIQSQVDHANQLADALVKAGVVQGAKAEEEQTAANDAAKLTGGDGDNTELADGDGDNTGPTESNDGYADEDDGGEEVRAGEANSSFEDLEVEVEVEATAPDTDSFEHKYKTLQGMYSSEKRRNTQLVDRVDTLETMLGQLNSAPAAPAEQQDAPVANPLTQDEIDEYGPDLVAVMRRAAREEFSAELNELRQENQSLKEVVGNVGHRQEVSERDKFYSALDNSIENWQAINSDQGFLGWLEEDDVYAGEPRKVLLRKAFDRSDAQRVARFFHGYLNENAAVQQATSEVAAATEPTPRKRKVDLATLAAPGAGASASADNTDESSNRSWKASEIAAFYKDVTKGAYKGREDVKTRTETQIHAAMRAGKILAGQ